LELSDIISKFEPTPTGWTFQQDIDRAREILSIIKELNVTTKKTLEQKYVPMAELFKDFDKLIEKIKLDIEKAKAKIDQAVAEQSSEPSTMDKYGNKINDGLSVVGSGLDQAGNFLEGRGKTIGTNYERVGNQTAAGFNQFERGSAGFFNVAGESINRETLILASRAMDDGLKITNEIGNWFSLFKNDKGTINVDLLQEYDRTYESSGIDRQREFISNQKEKANAVLGKVTADSASLIKDMQNPGFFKSMLDRILYKDPTTNPNFVYLNKPYKNETLEQARKIVFYVMYAMIPLAILYFLSSKTFVVPFFQTLVFWLKRYFVFLVWIMVVVLIYSFMTDWFMSLVREDIRYIAFMINPVLHPGVHEIWHSKYKKWIKNIVYGLSTLGFFIAALFMTVIIIFLILPLFLLLLWSSGQLMSYFEKEELDE